MKRDKYDNQFIKNVMNKTMKLFEYADKLWVKLDNEAVRDDVPFLSLGPDSYEYINDYLKVRYGIEIRSARYTSTDDRGVMLYVILEDNTIDVYTLLKLQNGLSGIVTVCSGTYADEDNPYADSYTSILIPIDQEVETYGND